MKKIAYFFLLFTSLVASQGISSGLFFSQEGASSSSSKKVIITFDAAPTSVNVNTAYYKYDKAFAFSFGMDDGLIGAYNTGVPLFNGGTVVYQDDDSPSGVGVTAGYPGLFYSDGAGNNIAFAATMNINMSSIGVSAGGANMSEFMLRDAYVKGFALTNHGYTPWTSFGGDFDTDPVIRDQEIIYEIEHNYDELRRVTGIKIDNFTAPSNDDIYTPITTQMKADGYLKIVNNIGSATRLNAHDETAEAWLATESTRWFSRDFATWTEDAVARNATDG